MRATFLPLDTMRAQTPLNPPKGAGIVGSALDLIDVEARLTTFAEVAIGALVDCGELALGPAHDGCNAGKRAVDVGHSGGRGGATGRLGDGRLYSALTIARPKATRYWRESEGGASLKMSSTKRASN